MTAEDFPIGATIQTTVYSIGDRSEVVTGTVTGYKFKQLLVKTEWHGMLSVEPNKATLVME